MNIFLKWLAMEVVSGLVVSQRVKGRKAWADEVYRLTGINDIKSGTAIYASTAVQEIREYIQESRDAV